MRNSRVLRVVSIILLLSMFLPTLGVFPGAVYAATFAIGDTVRVTSNLNVRTGPGTSYPEIVDPDYPGYAPTGTRGTIVGGPTSANSYIWWQVNFGPGLYTGWSIEGGLEKVTISDTTAPTVTSFSVAPATVSLGNPFTASFSVSDTGGSGLKQVELWRANDSGGSPGTWAQITYRSVSGNSYSGSFSDTPSSGGSYWYGIHAVDNANNWAVEPAPVEVTATTLDAPTLYWSSATGLNTFGDRGGIIIPKEILPEGQGNVIPLYVPLVVDGSNVNQEGDDWKTLNTFQKTINDWTWEAFLLGFSLACGDSGVCIIQALIEATDKAFSQLSVNIIVEINSSKELRAIVELGDPRGNSVVRENAGSGFTIPLSKSMVEAFGLEPGNYEAYINYSSLHRNTECIYYLSMSKDNKMEITPIIFDDDSIKIYKNLFLYGQKILDINGDAYIDLMRGYLSEQQYKSVQKAFSSLGFLTSGAAILIKEHSPTELRVYDASGHITGVLNEEIKEEIPNSIYCSDSKTVLILSADNPSSYRYELVGIEEGTYGLDVNYIDSSGTTSLNISNVSITPKTIHNYSIDWDTLSSGNKVVTMKIDNDGDGIFERVINLSGIAEGRQGLPNWVWFAVAGLTGLLGVLAGAFMVWRSIGKKQVAKG